MDGDINMYQNHKMPDLLKYVFEDREMKKRLLVTILIIFVYRLIVLIPAPGINIFAVINFLKQLAMRTGEGISTFIFDTPMTSVSVFALGVMPYISACVLLQIISAICKPLREIFFGRETGRKRITVYTYILTLCLSLIQSFFMSLWLEKSENFARIDILYVYGWPFRILITVSLTGGVFFLLWLSDFITKYGIGNGVPVLVLASLISVIPSRVKNLMYYISKHYVPQIQMIAAVAVYILIIVFIVFITKSFIKIPIKYKNANKNNNTNIPLRFSMVGKVPVILSSSIILIPATLGGFLTSNIIFRKMSLILTPGNMTYIILNSAMIFILTYIYMVVVFNPKYVKDVLNKYDAVIIKNGSEETYDNVFSYLDSMVSKVCLITGIFLVGVNVLSGIIPKLFNCPYKLYSIFSILEWMIIIGVIYDITKQIESKYEMKKYGETKEWKCVYASFSEIEAEIKKGYLVSKGIPCVVEPLRYTWGLPTQTAMDKYKINVPIDFNKDASELIR